LNFISNLRKNHVKIFLEYRLYSGLHRAAPLKTSGDKARGHKVKLVTAENVGSSSVCFEKC
jgi:hypothetical protein